MATSSCLPTYQPTYVPFDASFGYCLPENTGLTTNQKNATIVLNILGISPVIGAISGIARIVFGIAMIADRNGPDKTAFGITQIGRGVAEIAGLGPILLAVDILFGCIRGCKLRKYQEYEVIE